VRTGFIALFGLAGAVVLARGGMAHAAQDDPVFLGKPLSQWVADARGPQSAEDRARTIEALALAAEKGEGTVRVRAADTLATFGPAAKTAAPALAKALEDGVTWVRVAARDALCAIGPAAVPVVVETLERGKEPVRVQAALVLRAMGADARDAIPALKKALQDASPAIRSAAADALKEIEGRPDAPPQKSAHDTTPGSITPRATRPIRGKPGDWTQFRGPGRDGLCHETGLLQTWPEGGPKLLWRLNGLGTGFSSVSIVGSRLFTMGDRAGEESAKAQFILAFDLAARKELWATRVGPPHTDGPRCTPTVDGNLLYALGTDGDLVCAEAATGKVRWHKHLAKDFGGKMMSIWKYSESPLVDGDRLVVTPGGKDAALVALDKKTGELLWKCAVPELGEKGKDGAGYSSAVVAEIAGVRQYVQLVGRGVVGIEAATGKFLWGYNRIANTVANIPTPVVRGDHVFVATAYNTGCALLKIIRDGDRFRAEEVYFLGPRAFENHHGGVVLVGDYLYGGSGTNKGEPVCIELPTGRIAWRAKAPAPGSAAVLYADGGVLFRYDRGPVVLLEATPEAFRVKGQFMPPAAKGPAWPHPVIHGGRLYLRHDDLLLCYDVRAERKE